MKESNGPQEHTIPNIHVPENERVLAYLKEMHPFKEIIVPFSEKRVSQDTVPADLIGRLSSMSSLRTSRNGNHFWLHHWNKCDLPFAG